MTKETTALTPRMEQTLARARELAQDRGHDYVGTEHVLLALLDDPNGIAGGVLHRLGYAPAVRDEVIRIIESDGYATPSNKRAPQPPSIRHDESPAE
jgi:ATP-dependent Clp protease ATP-binding subunit ClpA